MLSIEDLTVRFEGVTALQSVDFELPERGIFGLIGPNGSGKTTLINAITGIYRATGSARFGGTELLGLPPERIARLGIARTFQNLRLFLRMTVLENVQAAQNTLPGIDGRDLLLTGGAAERARRDRAAALLTATGLSAYADRLAGALPLAMQRRLELARALAREPALLLLDEPSGGMTPAETAEMTELIAAHTASGPAVLIVEHKMALITALCGRLTVLDYGRIIAEGAPEAVLQENAVIDAYLGTGDDDA